MQEILFEYRLNPTTWAYISALMMVGVYFKFQRFLSVRNLDIIGLIAFSPGFLLVYHGLLLPQNAELIRAGYVWLFAIGAFFLIRLLLDPVMVRRPLLEPNLSAGGLAFTGLSLLVFLMANVITSPQERLESVLAKQEVPASPPLGYPPFSEFTSFSKEVAVRAAPSNVAPSRVAPSRVAPSKASASPPTRSAAAPTPEAPPIHSRLPIAIVHTLTILAHLGVLVGMVWIGFRHFDNIQTGIAAAALYLLTFYTSQLTSQIDYVAPAMLLVWAIAAYRRPIVAGILLGLAGGLIYYPLFLLPLWCGFYWRRGLARFGFGVVLALGVLVLSLTLTSPSMADFTSQLRLMFGVRNPFDVKLSGFWQYYDPVYRIPVATAFGAICLGLALWPAQKNLGTLLSCSAAVMLATQFWHARQGGLCMGWYLPLLILTIFRPNLEDRVALSAVKPLWGKRKKGLGIRD